MENAIPGIEGFVKRSVKGRAKVMLTGLSGSGKTYLTEHSGLPASAICQLDSFGKWVKGKWIVSLPPEELERTLFVGTSDNFFAIFKQLVRKNYAVNIAYVVPDPTIFIVSNSLKAREKADDPKMRRAVAHWKQNASRSRAETKRYLHDRYVDFDKRWTSACREVREVTSLLVPFSHTVKGAPPTRGWHPQPDVVTSVKSDPSHKHEEPSGSSERRASSYVASDSSEPASSGLDFIRGSLLTASFIGYARYTSMTPEDPRFFPRLIEFLLKQGSELTGKRIQLIHRVYVRWAKEWSVNSTRNELKAHTSLQTT